jgi:hypothetical protein
MRYRNGECMTMLRCFYDAEQRCVLSMRTYNFQSSFDRRIAKSFAFTRDFEFFSLIYESHNALLTNTQT